ncbi:glycine cleavage system protein H [Desulfospira joergensenii]|uniref:glycine cleavage system protein H n=1 Tax=Desulfospira joergensenii TaxID=53329 RepID=UPI001377A216|nr:hypothetical protein [Desulfospira joergensenii]
METRTTANRTKAKTPCIWMGAGVVKKKTCNHFNDCHTCRFDAGMKKGAATGRHMTWQEAMRRLDSKERTCRHALTGRTGPRICPMNYNCKRCDFDQLFEDTLCPAAATENLHTREVKGFNLPSDHYFHTGHAWARIEQGGFIRVGMDDFSLKVLGSPDHLELPLMGQELNQGRSGWGMRRRDKEADVLSPINGVITRVNPHPMKSPEQMGEAPYSQGWLFTVHHPDPKAAVKPLMDDEKSPAWLGNEVSGLEEMIQDVAGPLSADGGTLIPDVYGSLPGLGWEALVSRFLGT